MKKYFFGWQNLKFLLKELIKIYSGEKSYFSKKRLESGIAFIILQGGMMYYLIHHISNNKMDMYDMLMWAGVEATISGYMINHIQKEKKPTDTTAE